VAEKAEVVAALDPQAALHQQHVEPVALLRAGEEVEPATCIWTMTLWPNMENLLATVPPPPRL
jgi:hypothetical protein